MPYNNKIVTSDGETLIDLTADTVTAERLLVGHTAHDKSGAPVTGTLQADGGTKMAICDYSACPVGDEAYTANGE